MSQTPLNLLCVEPNFPGRLGPAADWLVRKRGYRCHFACNSAAPNHLWPASVGGGLDLVPYNVGGVAREPIVAWPRHFERALCYAYGAWEVIDARRIRPVDVILARSGGLGSSLFLPVTYPRTPILQRFDYFAQPSRYDLADEDMATLSHEYIYWRRSLNAMDLVELENGVTPWVSSHWQRELYPPEYRDSFVVLSEGVDCRFWSAPAAPRISLGTRTIPQESKVVTFVASVPDRLRGFDRFVQLAAQLIAERHDVLCIAVGAGPVNRMLDVRDYGQAYADATLREANITDTGRFWSVGRLESAQLQALLARANLHLYPGRVYPLARSLFEAMAAGACVLANDTPPVREVIKPQSGGLLVDAASAEALHEAARRALADDELRHTMGRRATATVREHFDVEIVMPRLAAELERLALAR